MLASFPKNKNKRAFNSKLYKNFNWIEYSIIKDQVYCFVCRHFTSTNGPQFERTFVNKGFSCWQKQAESFKYHTKTNYHKLNFEKYTMFLNLNCNKNYSSVASGIIHSRKKEVEDNRQHVYYLLKTTLYLAKQGISFRGHNESKESSNRGNYIELLNMFCDDNVKLKLESRYGHYMSPEYQNDCIKIIASITRSNIIKQISSIGAFSILVDETKDTSKKEQLSFIIRFVDNELNVFEKALGCYHMVKCDAPNLSQEIQKIVMENNLDINKCIAQCYDGASVMSGVFSGVQKRIADVVPQAIYMHCYAHRLNLCLIHSIQSNSIVVSFFNTVQSLYKYLMNGHTRYELFMKVQENKNLKAIHLERLVETRWSYWHTSIQKIKMRITEILDVLKVLIVQDDQPAKALGLFKEVSTFRFILVLHIMEKLLETVNCLSCELQNSKIILPAAMDLVDLTRNELITLRSDESYSLLYNKAKIHTLSLGITVEEEEEINTRLRRKLQPFKKLEDYYIMSTTGKSDSMKSLRVKNMKTEVFYCCVDR